MRQVTVQVAANGFIITFPDNAGQMLTVIEHEQAKMVQIIDNLTKPKQTQAAEEESAQEEAPVTPPAPANGSDHQAEGVTAVPQTD